MLVHLIESEKFHYKLQAFYQRNKISDISLITTVISKERVILEKL